MTHRVGARALRDPRPPHRRRHRSLHDRFVQVVAAGWAPARIPAEARRREDELPSPLDGRRRVLADTRLRQDDAPESARQIAPVHLTDMLEMPRERRFHTLGQRGDSILAPLPTSHDDVRGRKVQILDPQLQALAQAKPSSIQHRDDQPSPAIEPLQDRADLVPREDDRQARGSRRAHQRRKVAEFLTEHVAVQK